MVKERKENREAKNKLERRSEKKNDAQQSLEKL